jgi:hypothetical protein
MSSDSQRPFWSAPAERSGDGVWVRMVVIQSGAALHLPPQSKERSSDEQLC